MASQVMPVSRHERKLILHRGGALVGEAGAIDLSALQVLPHPARAPVLVETLHEGQDGGVGRRSPGVHGLEERHERRRDGKRRGRRCASLAL